MRNQKIIGFCKKKNLNYDIVIKNKKKNRFMFEKIGIFNKANITSFWLNFERFAYWLNKGAYLHPTLKKYLVKMILKKSNIK